MKIAQLTLVTLFALCFSFAAAKLPINNVALGGGGISIYAGAGAIVSLRADPAFNLQSCTGTNDGAILCTLLVANYSNAEILAALFASGTPPRPLDAETVGNNIVNFSGVFYVQDEFVGLIDALLYPITGSPSATFAQLYAVTGKILNVVVYNLNLRRLEYMNVQTSPALSVSSAVAASVAYTYIYDTVVIGAYTYTSGAVRDNYPIESYIDSLWNTVGVNYVFNYDTVNWVYNDTQEANVVVGFTNVLNYLINPSENIPAPGLLVTCNVPITEGIIQYSHYLSVAEKNGLVAAGQTAMANLLAWRL